MSPEEQKPDRRRGPRANTIKAENTTSAEIVPDPKTQEPALDIDAIKAQLREELMAELKAEKVASDPDAVEPITEVDPSQKDAVTVNFVEDGMTLLGQVWFRGQELTVAPGSKEWQELTDPKTKKNVLLLDENEQIFRWGRRMFRPGKWVGAGFDLNDPNLTDEERATLKSIQDKRAGRGLAPGEPPKRRLFSNS